MRKRSYLDLATRLGVVVALAAVLVLAGVSLTVQPKQSLGTHASHFALSIGPAAAYAKTTYVYVTKTGLKYHRAGCRYLKYSRRRVTLKWAKAHGYKACKVCKPPK